jgi:hypothetical protein
VALKRRHWCHENKNPKMKQEAPPVNADVEIARGKIKN